jgi:hypothetical protein
MAYGGGGCAELLEKTLESTRGEHVLSKLDIPKHLTKGKTIVYQNGIS